MARVAELVEPANIIIENVPGAIHDSDGVVETTVGALNRLGYHFDLGVLDASVLGVAQKRKRLFLVASRSRVDLDEIVSAFEVRSRSVEWAIKDLEDSVNDEIFNSPSTPTQRNAERIRFLHQQDLYELPDTERPDCHRTKNHSYRSIYGRLRWEGPSQTITTGFGSMGQGRFVHPSRERLLTPNEAARLQFIPDFFRFGDLRRGRLAQLIGNAVPPKFTYVLTLSLLGASPTSGPMPSSS